jgi:hypothetical protein
MLLMKICSETYMLLAFYYLVMNYLFHVLSVEI